MIIYGIRVRESAVGEGIFVCPRCRGQQGCRHLVMKRWFTLYFIPVIPLGQVGEQVECLGCYSRYAPDILMGPPDSGPLPAMVMDDARPVPQGFYAPAAQQPTNSALAIASLFLGLLSPVLLCACGLSILSSLGAIVTGHVALAKIHRSAGKLGGRGMALSGLVLGYLLLAVSIVGWARLGPAIYGGWQDAENRAKDPDSLAAKTPEERLLAAEVAVLSAGTDGVATGNTPEAQELAAAYSASLKSMRDTLFTKDRERMLTLTAGQFIVHCELHGDRCALLVHVPAYRDFTSEAKKVLEISAWQLAQQAVEGKVEPRTQLAVGLRGTALYGAILIGKVETEADESGGYKRKDRDALVAFFPATEASPEAPDGAPEVGPSAAEVAEMPAAEATLPQVALVPPADRPAPQQEPQPEPQPREVEPAVAPRVSAPAAESERRQSRRAKEEALAAAIPQLTDIVQKFPDLGWNVQSLAFAPGGRFLVAGKLDQAVLMLDAQSGGRLQAEEGLNDLGQVTGVAFSFDGSRLIAGGYSGAIRTWKVDGEGRLEAAGSLQGHDKPVTCLVASPAARFVISGSAAGDLIWQTYDEPSQTPRSLAALERNVLAIHLPQDRQEAMATDGRKLIHFELREGKILRTFDLGRRSARAAAFSSDGTQFAVVLGKEILLGSAQTGGSLTTLSAPDAQWSAAFRPGGNELVTGGRGEACVWRLPAGEPVARVDLGKSGYIQSIALTQDGRLLAAIPASAGQTLTVVRLPDAPGTRAGE